MARQRFDKLSRERREEILTVAGTEFAAHGFDGASLNSIISQLGISKGSLYYYFTDKADLFARVVEWIERIMKDGPGTERLAALTAETFWSGLAELMYGLNDYLRDHPWLLGFIKLLYKQPKVPFDDAFQARLRESVSWLEDVLIRGQELGVVRTDLPLGLLTTLTFAVGEEFDRWWLTTNLETEVLLEDLERMSTLAWDLMRRLVGTPNFTRLSLEEGS